MKLTIVDYGIGNLESIFNACRKITDININVSANPQDLTNSDYAILPGVGAFSHAVNSLERNNWINSLDSYVESKRPILGICLGMQLFFQNSYEFGLHKGLNYFEGEVIKLPECEEKLPNVGWRKIHHKDKSSMFNGIDQDSYFYFTHSYRCKPIDKKIINSSINFCGEDIPSSTQYKNIWSTQFHPEKSAEPGLILLKNFFNS